MTGRGLREARSHSLPCAVMAAQAATHDTVGLARGCCKRTGDGAAALWSFVRLRALSPLGETPNPLLFYDFEQPARAPARHRPLTRDERWTPPERIRYEIVAMIIRRRFSKLGNDWGHGGFQLHERERHARRHVRRRYDHNPITSFRSYRRH